MPAYQYPPERICLKNSTRWEWMQSFYEKEVSRPASDDETLDEVRLRAASVRPTPVKLAWMEQELITFPHFGMSTFSGVQQGTGKEDPRRFNPEAFDARKWVEAHKAFGAKMIVFVAKHHDGFMLWPSKLNDYSVASSPWRKGKGDMVREMAEACREGGLKLGLYVSLWDQHDPRCDHPRREAEKTPPEQRETYQNYIESQLHETLDGRYGEISEIWFDGAGTTGTEDWNRVFEIIHTYQPKCQVAMCGFGVRWCGNESAVGSPVNWNVLPVLPEMAAGQWVPFHYKYCIGRQLPGTASNLDALRGKELFWFPEECDTRLQEAGWHYSAGNPKPRSLELLISTYYVSIGMGSVMILSPSPDKSGLIPDDQVAVLREFRAWIDKSFADNLLARATLTISPEGGTGTVDDLLCPAADRSWVALESARTVELEACWTEPQTFDNLVLMELIAIGQRVESFVLEAWKDGAWQPVAAGQTIGRKRVMPFSSVTADRVRIRITGARANPALRFAGLYRAIPYGNTSTTQFAEQDYRPALAEPSGLVKGMRYQYFKDQSNGFLPYQEMFDEQVLKKYEALSAGIIDNPVQAVQEAPEARGSSTHTAMQFTGYLRAPVRGVYTLRAAAHTGCRVYVDGRLDIENDVSGSMPKGEQEKVAQLPLLAGLHELRILYWQGLEGDRKLHLSLEWPGSPVRESAVGFGYSPETPLVALLECEPQ